MTGSSRGIGRAIALRLAEQGWRVAVHYTSQEEAARQVEKELGAQASGVYQADLSEKRAPAHLWRTAVSDEPLHALVNNAGVYMPIDFASASDNVFEANWHKTFAVNFEAPVRMIRAALPYFENEGGGRILNVASRVGFRGEPGAAMYAASKAALINLTRSLAIELAGRKIAVFGMAPGWVETAMARDGMGSKLQEILAGIPLGRMATPEDCAAVAGFLLSDEARYLSGQTIDINGASYFH